MDRRQFVQIGLGAAGVLAMAPAGALDRGATKPGGSDVVFYDAALARARQLAAQLPGGDRAVALPADPMSLLEQVERLKRQHRPPASIAGITREAAPFCLQAMRGADRAAMSLRRIDQDLFLWTLKLGGV